MVKMLIVDDESFVRECLRTQIVWDSIGVEVSGTAKNGEEALQLYRESRPQLILSDVRMPKINGIELMRNIRQINAHVEFVFISGYQDFDYVKRALDYGASGYVLKPIETNELVEAIARAVKKIEKESMDKAALDNSLSVNPYEVKYKRIVSRIKQADKRCLLESGNDFERYIVSCKDFEEKQQMLQQFIKELLKTSNREQKEYLLKAISKLYLCQQDKELTDFWKNFRREITELYSASPVPAKKQSVEEIKAYIQDHFKEVTLSLTSMSEQLNISPNYISTLFSKKCKCSIVTYIHLLRMEEAKKQLADSDTKISCIAESIGYENTTYFSTIFKRMVGKSPKEYRLQKRG